MFPHQDAGWRICIVIAWLMLTEDYILCKIHLWALNQNCLYQCSVSSSGMSQIWLVTYNDTYFISLVNRGSSTDFISVFREICRKRSELCVCVHMHEIYICRQLTSLETVLVDLLSFFGYLWIFVQKHQKHMRVFSRAEIPSV